MANGLKTAMLLGLLSGLLLTIGELLGGANGLAVMQLDHLPLLPAVCDRSLLIIRFRLIRSARCPAGSDNATTGTAMTNPTRPSAVAERVRA